MSAESNSLEAELLTARMVAEQAGEMIRSRWGDAIAISFKGEVDLVSEVDLAAETLIVQALKARFPDDALVAEEGGAQSGQSGRCWYIDPLDGTTNFSQGIPHFCVSIALAIDGQVQVGVIHEPLRGWTFHGKRGSGAWLNGKKLQVSQTEHLKDAVLATGFPYDRWTNPDNNTGRFASLLRQSRGIRRMGSAALDLCYVAAGWFDGFWEYRLNAWDLAAGLLLIEEAGGRTSGFDGQAGDPVAGELVASNGKFHVELLDALNSAPRMLDRMPGID